MKSWLNRLHQKNELTFALVWIGVYCLANSIGNVLSEAIGVNSLITLMLNGLMTAAILLWIKKQNLLTDYGLCKSQVPAGKLMWYLPLVLFASTNLWLGGAGNLPVLDTVCYILSMLCVGFLEEVIFRGFLFKALAKENVKRAIIISSVTFGIGHILNLFNGSGMELVENLCQVLGAIAWGLLFVILFYRSGSLLPCIAAHGVNNAVSVFANETAITTQTQLLLTAANLVIAIGYILFLNKTLPKKTT